MRKKLITWLFYRSEKIYTRWFKKSLPWGLTRSDLLEYPPGTLGKRLGEFLERHGFELLPKVERHDVYHLLTGCSTAVEDEIAQQYLCLGNGKRSPYMMGAVTVGTIILPEYAPHYFRSFLRGRKANPFHNLDYRRLLNNDYETLRERIFPEG